MRSSVIFMGSILARCGEVRLSEPGGCALGQRPVDLHLKALRALGAEITESEGEILCRAASLRGCPIRLEYPSVGATENVMLAACGAKGETRLTNAAREPEIVDLQDFLNAKGARISGAGSSDICIRGFDCRPKTEHTVMPDRIAAATFLCGAAAAGGDICLRDTVPTHVYTVTDALEAMGCVVTAGRDEIRLRSDGRLRACPPIVTMPYPGFPTDAQPLLMAAALRAEGTSYFTETVFDDRFRCTAQMRRFGGEIRLRGRTAEVRGVQTLHGGGVRAEDLRGGAALIIAALAAEGRSEITDAGYIARGYEDLAGALGSLGGAVSLRGVE